MPTYEYHCPKCKANYELRQGFDAETTQKCQECGKGTAKRVLHAPRVHFKGSGFYVTDSKGKNSAGTDADHALTKTESDGPASSAATEKSETKSESKSESKPETKKASASSDTAAAS